MEDSNIRVIRILQPSYEVDPIIDNRFTQNKVEQACAPVVNEFLRGKAWSDVKEHNTELSQSVTNLVMEKIWELGFKRFKVVVQTNMGENKGQSVRVASHCLWESNLDGAAEINFCSETLWCTVVVLGLYVH